MESASGCKNARAIPCELDLLAEVCMEEEEACGGFSNLFGIFIHSGRYFMRGWTKIPENSITTTADDSSSHARSPGFAETESRARMDAQNRN